MRNKFDHLTSTADAFRRAAALMLDYMPRGVRHDHLAKIREAAETGDPGFSALYLEVNRGWGLEVTLTVSLDGGIERLADGSVYFVAEPGVTTSCSSTSRTVGETLALSDLLREMASLGALIEAELSRMTIGERRRGPYTAMELLAQGLSFAKTLWPLPAPAAPARRTTRKTTAKAV
jgi:hypothetical protein